LPLDVRKGSAFPEVDLNSEEALLIEEALAGKAEPFRTSGGKAASSAVAVI